MSGEPCKCGAEDCRSCNPLYAQQEEGLRGYHKPDKRPDLPACPFCGATAESGDYIHIDRLGEARFEAVVPRELRGNSAAHAARKENHG